jgi:hypothetical protein
VKDAKLRVLARVYPARIAGRAAKWDFEAANSSFQMTYKPRGRAARRGASTVISIPRPVHYPGGYVARITGGRRVSRPNARSLRVKGNVGADEVRIAVQPRVP